MDPAKLTASEFKQISKLVYDRTGIFLPENKLGMLSNRLRKRLRELKLEGFSDYYKLIKDEKQCEIELPHFLSAVTTNETYFFRNEALWKFIRGTWIPELVERKRDKPAKSIRVWSAASSSGEEAFTTAICLREELKDYSKWKIKIIGSDISQRVLDKASEGLYDEYSVQKTPADSKRKWFKPVEQQYQVKDDIRKMVTFQTHNLRDAFPAGNFDLVFLRNVLMYFDTKMKLKVLDVVTNALTPSGYLVIGDVDPVRSTQELREAIKVTYRCPNIYQKAPLTERVAATV